MADGVAVAEDRRAGGDGDEGDLVGLGDVLGESGAFGVGDDGDVVARVDLDEAGFHGAMVTRDGSIWPVGASTFLPGACFGDMSLTVPTIMPVSVDCCSDGHPESLWR